MRTIVALDLETTGLDPDRDDIIEIGAVKFQGARVEAEYQQLINPGRPIPSFITQLTGINDDMLTQAPRFNSVANELVEFVGDHPVLGQNIAFDLSFLRKKGLFQHNLAMDTYDMASVLLPTAGRYSLRSLASHLGVFPGSSHRALDDSKTVHQVYLRLGDLIQQLPRDLLEEIVRAGEEIEWGAGSTFEDFFRQLGQTDDGRPDGERPADERHKLDLFAALKKTVSDEPESSDEGIPLDVEEIASILEPGGAFANELPGYEHRSQQITMVRAVADALINSKHLLVEAGTGTGKSLAYLIPAFAWAEENNTRVVVSTNTINLQDQLIFDDIPTINHVLGKHYRGAVLKGRRNYLCPRRLSALRRLGPRTSIEMRVLAKVLVWLHQGGSGDRNEINLNGPQELAIWSRISADDEDCSSENCSRFSSSGCPYFLAREAAEAAHVVIANHALLLADIGTGNRVIPEYKYLIVDEAHHLESATTSGLSFRVSEGEIKRLLSDLGNETSGLMQSLLQFSRVNLPPSEAAELERHVTTTIERVQESTDLISEFFRSLENFLSQHRDGKPVGPYGQQERVIPSTRTLPDWTDIEIAWDNLRQPLSFVVMAILDFSELLVNFTSEDPERGEDFFVAVRAVGRNLNEIYERLDNMIFEPDPKVIYWIHVSQALEKITLHAAPLEIGHLVERFLWHEKEAVIMTSATMTTAGEFDYIRQRLNALDAEELLLGSPFDYETSTLLYLANDIPEPAEKKAYQRAFEHGLINLCRATHGRTLVLFTSYNQLKQTSRAITEPLLGHGIQIFEQGEGSSRHALLEMFRTTEGAVLLGTRSFWEGVDVPGEALSVLVIARLPFDVPNDPIIAARAETYEFPFDQYTVPEAVLRFRQGFGRLIRTRSDRGVVAVLDRRITSKQYGRAFIDSLPDCTMRVAPLTELPEASVRWLGD
jgi:DNA polymerase-3 subunit epsilon/ATP-dependent DNA helicase DinG